MLFTSVCFSNFSFIALIFPLSSFTLRAFFYVFYSNGKILLPYNSQFTKRPSAGQRRIHFKYSVNCVHVNIGEKGRKWQKKNYICLWQNIVDSCYLTLVEMWKKVQREIFIKLSLKFVHFPFDILGSRVLRVQSKLCNNHLPTTTINSMEQTTAHIPVNNLLDTTKKNVNKRI